MNIRFPCFLISLLFAQGVIAQDHCFSSPYQLFDKFDHIFVKGTLLPVRRAEGNESVVVGLRVKSASLNKNFESVGIRDGAIILEICGNSVGKIFKSSDQNPTCCSPLQDGKISVTVSNSLIETYKTYFDADADF
ncbi:hypothetical protein [Lacimicrobium alkaliphilum]|uniref:Uncharacterized protein n=1 Tax=Lacimicrobium alkaliphilum TaxID=1526571 RepID=A0A0U3B0C7_9ALTE|nr:hypothetical protein [Lacimicrobium alkaliphilum]ALS98728.1 hypothetical protein AT746_10905 [Lacimicrobium alkaliphilum]